MKRILLLILLILPLMSAVEIDMKSEFAQGETLMATISGNFLTQVEKENIVFYREHVKIPIEYDIIKIDDIYYVYAQLGNKDPNNYSLRIENVKYMQGTNMAEEDIIKGFVITEEIADFKIDSGFVIAEDSFVIEVQNLQDFKIEIKINENKTSQGFFEALFGDSTTTGESVELNSGQVMDLEFHMGSETSFRIVQLSTNNITYKIPVYVFVSSVTEPKEEPDETTNEEISEETEEIKIVSTKTCAEEEGIICGENEKCSETPIQARDATCCLANCEEIPKSNAGKIIGWLMVVIIVVTIFWFFKTKYKKAKKEINLLDIAKGKK